ncbi:MAG: type II toxin-antitoxin system RelE/ParE family toxin [Gammaproteobacteria bacterium]|nr:type II toxin-antitoxin system RelE/ParE family toxin [uncultured Pseudacidovorax sp.]
MMRLQWTSRALSDLARLHDFLAPRNPAAAAKAVQALVRAPEVLHQHPRLGEKVEGFADREVRRILALSYELRYEVVEDTIYILRLWHTRERR